MKDTNFHFDEHLMLHNLKHYLPAQASLKDFIHHNTLHGFQNLNFFEGIFNASEIFGYKVLLTLEDYRNLYRKGRIREDILESIISERCGKNNLKKWKEKALTKKYESPASPRIENLRHYWKQQYHINLDSLVHPKLFRILGSYLDQGIAIWNFPVNGISFLHSIKELEKNSYTSFFKTKRARAFLFQSHWLLEELLEILVGDASLYEQYLFDQQFSHPGWSGMVSAIEDNHQTLLDTKHITVAELVYFELLLEIDAMDHKFGENWSPLSLKLKHKPTPLFSEVKIKEYHEVLMIFHQAFEWSYYDDVLAAMQNQNFNTEVKADKSFQAVFCIDDREGSLRYYLEKLDKSCETFSTAGFFNVEFFYQPEDGKFYDKLCPAPVTPKYLIKELGNKEKRGKEAHLSKRSHTLVSGFLIVQTIGFWSAIKLFFNIFRPSMSQATASSFRHMDKFSQLSIDNKSWDDKENNLQIGFTTLEMADRVEGLLRSIGLIENFSRVVYMVGHGSSSVNNPHYAAYNCGACSGRPGSVNARVFCYMANKPEVRALLDIRGISIPDSTQFIGALHDTTCDDISYYDEHSLNSENEAIHKENETLFIKALDLNAKERSRRFNSINTKKNAEYIHKRVRRRSVSLFEPRPELNHATNALCIIGQSHLFKNIFLDRRSFLNSYNYSLDLNGQYLLGILKAVAPVCGGINLEYFFSRVDNQTLGAGTKLPHNVVGLFGVANGTDGDLRPGLPSQMIEVHDPIRLMVIVEHFPDIVLQTIKKDGATYEWFHNNWIHLVVLNPETKQFYLFKEGAFSEYLPLNQNIKSVTHISDLIESHDDFLPVHLIKSAL